MFYNLFNVYKTAIYYCLSFQVLTVKNKQQQKTSKQTEKNYFGDIIGANTGYTRLRPKELKGGEGTEEQERS